MSKTLSAWKNGSDAPDVPGETVRQVLKDLYQENRLVQNRMEVGGHRVDLRKVTMPLLNIYGQYDHLVPPEACELLAKAVASRDSQDFCLESGHIGIYVSARFQKEVVPKIATWLLERDN